MSLQLRIDLDFLEKLDPPASFPPTEDELTGQLEGRFLAECDRFITSERALYRCAKAVETRLTRLLNSSQDIERRLARDHDRLDFIAHELVKLKEQEGTARERERVLRMLCELVRMEELRKELLLGEKREALEVQPKAVPVQEEEYLRKLQKLTQIIRDSDSLAHLREAYPLVREIVLELQSIATSAYRLVAKKLLTPRMVELVVGEYYPLFEKEGEVVSAVVGQRLQGMRIGLTAMINSLNYASNTQDLFQSIFATWAELLSRELALFARCNRPDLPKSINTQLLSELLPKIEKTIFKVKDLVALVRIRKAYSGFEKTLSSIWSEGDGHEWEGVGSAVAKCEALIGSRLAEESQSLQNSKYNIYTMASYIPIREHLERVKQCYEQSIEGERLDWEVGFYSLCSSRDPKNYPNNKSLLIFNLNIWYLYLKLLPNGRHKEEGQELLKWCSNTFTAINVQEAKKKYYDSFEKVLELCGNLPAFKTTLYAEISLLGHEDLRRDISRSIRFKYVEAYEQSLAKIEQAPMNHEETKAFCQARKINLNKFGKHSHAICVLSPPALLELLE